MKVRYKGTLEATLMPKCNDEKLSGMWMVVEGEHDVFYTDEQFKEKFEKCRKTKAK